MRGHEGRRRRAVLPRRVRVRARRPAASPNSCASSPAPAPKPSSLAAGAGDEEALEIVERAERWAGHGIVTTAQLVNPEVVVIGGGVARAGEVLLAPLRDRLQRMVRRPPRLAASPLAERGPLLGAIRLALDELEPMLLAELQEAA